MLINAEWLDGLAASRCQEIITSLMVCSMQYEPSPVQWFASIVYLGALRYCQTIGWLAKPMRCCGNSLEKDSNLDVYEKKISPLLVSSPPHGDKPCIRSTISLFGPFDVIGKMNWDGWVELIGVQTNNSEIWCRALD